MNKYIAPFFFVAVIGNVQATEITENHVTGTRFKFTAKLDAPLIAGNKVKIDFGKNLVPMTCVETTCTLFRTMNSDVMPAYKIGIYNAKNVLQSTNLEANSTTNLPVYTKIANDGSELPDSAQLGTNPKDWACTKDNNTGLIWEVKTDDNLRSMNRHYTSFTTDYLKCTEYSWCGELGKYGDVTNVDSFVKAVNLTRLCGFDDWRVPMKRELEDLTYCSDEKYAIPLGANYRNNICTGTPTYPTINSFYFPNTVSALYVSSTPGPIGRSNIWHVDFSNGSSDTSYKYSTNLYVRLVRNGQ